MFDVCKKYFKENFNEISATIACLNGGDYRPYIDR